MAEPVFDVIVCGSLHLDIMVGSPHLPRIDETVSGTEWRMKCGGKGGNQAVMPARMGAKTAMIGRIGADDFGSRLMAHLAAAGVDSSCVDVDPQVGSGMSVAIVDRQGDYGAVIVSGSNLSIDPDRAAQQFKMLGGAKIVLLQNEIPEAVNRAVAQAAREQGAYVVLNAAPARHIGSDFTTAIDCLVVNRVEAEMMSGHAVSDPSSAAEALAILSDTTRDVIITLGGEGLVYQAKSGKPQRLDPHPIVVASTHGAGDCFLGALAVQRAKGADLDQACAVANSVAAHFVSTPEDQRSKVDFLLR